VTFWITAVPLSPASLVEPEVEPDPEPEPEPEEPEPDPLVLPLVDASIPEDEPELPPGAGLLDEHP
jgi:hypothetical protein